MSFPREKTSLKLKLLHDIMFIVRKNPIRKLCSRSLCIIIPVLLCGIMDDSVEKIVHTITYILSTEIVHPFIYNIISITNCITPDR